MVTLISEMSRVKLAIDQLATANANSRLLKMTSHELQAEMQRVMKVTNSSSGTKQAQAWKEYSQLTKLYSRRLTEEQTGSLTQADGTSKRFGILEITRWISEGEVERAMNGLEAILANGIHHSNVGTVQTAAGFFLDLLGDVDRSLEINQLILDFVAAKLGAGPPDLGNSDQRSLLATRARARQGYARALAEAGRVKKLTQWAKVSETEIRNVIAAFVLHFPAPRGYVETQELFALHFSVAAQFGFLGDLLLSKKKTDRARKSHLRAIEEIKRILVVARECQEQDYPLLLNLRNICHLRLATWQGRIGSLDAASATWKAYFQGEKRYREATRAGLGQYYFATAQVLYAEVLLKDKRWKAASKALDRAIECFRIMKQSATNPYLALAWKPFFLAGKLAEKQQLFPGAIENYLKAVGMIETLYGKLRSGKLQGQFLKMRECRATYRNLIRLYLKTGESDKALEMLERSKSAVLLDMLRSLPMRQRHRWPQALLQREQDLKRKMREQKRERETGSKKGTRSGAENSRKKLFYQYDLFLRDVAQALRRSSPDKASTTQSIPHPKAAELKQVVGTKRVVCSFFDDGENLSALILVDGSLRVFPLGSSRKVAKKVRKLRRRISARSPRWKKLATSLFGTLIAPWQSLLKDREELILVPTSILAGLPFAILPDKEGRFLADLLPLSNLSQASLLTQKQKPLPSSTRPLILADPDGSLPFARTEAARIIKALGDRNSAEVREGSAATEGFLKSRVGFLKQTSPPWILHLATHGLLDRGTHLASSLVLAPDEVEDGSLTFGEIFNDLDLRGSEVVVLSACNTGVGESGGGDELLGLSRAFQYAGARWVLASLWEVSDEASAALMGHFHAALQDMKQVGQLAAVDQALSRAQATLRRERPEWEHPFYWAAFVAYRR
jgi:CHAT domain-containing protein